MADVKWIKIATDIFNDEKILLIESLPEADTIITIWFKLLCLAGRQNNSGIFIMNDKIPYTDKMLATIFRRKEASVQMALKTFQEFEMIEIVDNVITIPNWDKYQKLDAYEAKKEYDRQYQAKKRLEQKEKLLVVNNRTTDSTMVGILDKEEDKDKEVLKENIIKEKNQPFSPKIPQELQELFDFWNSKGIVVHRTINEKMVQLLKKALDLYGQAQIKQAIENYSIVLSDSTYYFKTRWTIGDFVKQTNALPDFLPEGIKWINYQEYLKKSKKAREQDKYEIENSNKPAMEGMEIL
jgi:phage replisome organizer N-terminal domain protein|nr:MAG TPA: replisome organizer [Caudoviricetes sp.]